MIIRAVVAFVLWCVLLCAAYAQVPMTGAGLGQPGGGGGGYTGIGDLSGIGTAYWYIGGDCYHATGTYNTAQIYDTTGSAVTATVQCVNGVISTTAGSTWTWATVQANCLSTRCLIFEAFDQSTSARCNSGVCNFVANTSLTAANTPYFVYANGTTCAGQTAGGWCINSTGGSQAFTTGNSGTFNTYVAAAQPTNITCVGSSAAVGTGETDFYADSIGNQQIGLVTGGNGLGYAGSSFVTTANTTTNNHMAVVFGQLGASPITQLNNGTAVTTNQGTNGVPSGATANLFFANNHGGTISACFLSTTAQFGATVIGNVYSTWKAHFGGGLP